MPHSIRPGDRRLSKYHRCRKNAAFVLVEGGILLKPVEVLDRSPARVALAKFLAGRTWKGEGDEPNEAETMKAVLKEIRALRRSNESGSR